MTFRRWPWRSPQVLQKPFILQRLSVRNGVNGYARGFRPVDRSFGVQHAGVVGAIAKEHDAPLPRRGRSGPAIHADQSVMQGGRPQSAGTEDSPFDRALLGRRSCRSAIL